MRQQSAVSMATRIDARGQRIDARTYVETPEGQQMQASGTGEGAEWCGAVWRPVCEKKKRGTPWAPKRTNVRAVHVRSHLSVGTAVGCVRN